MIPMKRGYAIFFLAIVFILTAHTTYGFLSASIQGIFNVPVVAVNAPTIVSSESKFTATDGGGDTSFNTSTIAVTVSGNNPMLVACWHAEFGPSPNDPSKLYSWFFQYNGVWGRTLFDTDGYHGGTGNRNLRCAYWVNPPAGTHNLVVTIGARGVPATGAEELTVASILLKYLAQTFYPFRDTQKDISASVRTSETETVTSSSSDLVLHVVASSLTAPGTLGAGETSLIVANDGTDDASLLIAKKAGASSVTVSSSGWANTFPLQGLAFSVMPAGTAEDHVLFTDDFARIDENPLSKSGAWTQPSGAIGTVGAVALVSNMAKGFGTVEDIAMVATPTFPADQRVEMTIPNGSGYVRLWVRLSNAGGYILTWADAGNMQILKVPGYAQVGANIPLAFSFIAGDRIGFEAVGTTLNVYFDGQLMTSRTDVANTYPTGQPGLGSYDAINIGSTFEATSLPAHN